MTIKNIAIALGVAGVVAAVVWAWADVRKALSRIASGGARAAGDRATVADAPPASAPVQPAAVPLLRAPFLGPLRGLAPAADVMKTATTLEADATGLEPAMGFTVIP